MSEATPLPRSEFAVTRNYTYFNHAAVGVLPQSSLAELETFLRAHAEGGVLGTYPYEDRLPEYRAAIGRYIGAQGGGEIAIVRNTSDGANVVAQGIDWRPGDEVLLGDDEFPSNAIPWLALRERGVAVRELRVGDGRLTPQRLEREIGKRTRAIAVSWVAYADGYRHDLAGLARVAHAAGALLCVDAMQALGAFAIDVRACEVDALYCGAAKWLMGLHGSGFLYVRDALLERLRLAMPGWRSVENIWDFHNHEQPYAAQALRFEGGTPPFLGALAMARSIELFERCDPAKIQAHVLSLTDRLAAGLRAAGAVVHGERGGGASSGIVLFTLPGWESVELGRALQADGIVTTYRANGVRVAPHGYNTAGEIDALLERVAQYARAAKAKQPG